MGLDLSSRRIGARPPLAGAPIGATSDDALSGLKVSHITDASLAFLDIHPMNPFHTLVIPKQHFSDTFVVPLLQLTCRKVNNDPIDTDGFMYAHPCAKRMYGLAG